MSKKKNTDSGWFIIQFESLHVDRPYLDSDLVSSYPFSLGPFFITIKIKRKMFTVVIQILQIQGNVTQQYQIFSLDMSISIDDKIVYLQTFFTIPI